MDRIFIRVLFLAIVLEVGRSTFITFGRFDLILVMELYKSGFLLESGFMLTKSKEIYAVLVAMFREPSHD
ncbi:hypothetical protein RchiOBHm_Chr5g0075271 [Rosa chinensis]|uniref:Uncharacterized protein n=1 Tax=Rosa chinensis TaxID=74649 RepID=A0A2P6QLE9_ROSCH|nr:hypothetical protein RchiOBHm_Chr5g0075271 [Rosa chinensis]